jgi:signal transduction histidine kinase
MINLHTFFVFLFLLLAGFYSTAQEDPYKRHAESRNHQLTGDYRQYIDSAGMVDSKIEKRKYLEMALLEAEEKQSVKGILNSNYRLGKLYHDQGDTQKALEYYERVTALLEKHPDVLESFREATVFYDVAINYSYLSKYTQALKYFTRSEQIAREEQTDSLLSLTLRQIGNVYHYLNDLSNSSDYYYKALRIAQENNLPELEASAMNNIASNMVDLNQAQEGEEMYRRSLEIARKHGLANLVAVVSNNLGVNASENEKYDKALDYYHIALSYAVKNDDIMGRALYYNNIASVYLHREDYGQARKYLQRSLRDNNRLGNKEGLVNNYYNFAELLIEQKEFDSARVFVEKVDEITRELGNAASRSEYFNLLHNYYSETEDYKKALQYHKKYTALHDSITEAQTGEKISNLNSVYQERQRQQEMSELREKQSELRFYLHLTIFLSALFIIAVVYAYIVQRRAAVRIRAQNNRFKQNQKELANKNHELRLSKKKIEEINRDRNQLFSIISHDLRSPFNSLLGFSEMLAEEVREGADPESVKMMTENIHTSSMHLFELIQNLLEWANKERGKIEFRPEQVIVHKVATENIELAKQSANHKQVQIVNKIDKHIMVEADVNMINTIFRNLIFNAIKFTPRHGKVELSAGETSEKVVIHVQDNGTGMSEDDRQMILFGEDTFTRKGTQNEKGAGLGLVLTKDFIKRHSGSLDISTKLGEGTTFHVTIPK